MNENIILYIQQYRQTYTREAITEQLRRAGYNLAEIEAAWNVVEAGAVSPDQPPPQSGPPAQSPYGFPPPGAVPGQPQPPDPYAGQRPPGWEAPRNQTTPPGAPGWQPPPGGYGPPGGQMYAQPPLYNQPPPYYVPPPPRPRLRSNPRFWAAFLGYLLGFPALVVGSSAIDSDLGAVILWLGFLAGVVGAIVLNRKDYAVSRGLIAGIISLIVVPTVLTFVAIVILFGICIVGGTRI